MKGPTLPRLSDTGRRYVEQTRRARLASPGIQRYGPAPRAGGRIVGAVLALATLVAALLWLSARG